MSNANGGTIVVRIEGRDVGLSDLLARVNSQMNSSGASVRNYATAMSQIDPATRSAESELARYAQSLASVAAKSGDTGGAVKILGQALQQLTPATTSANQVQAQLQGYLNNQAAAAEKASFSLGNLAKGLYVLQAGYQAVMQVASAAIEAIGKGNELEKTLLTFRVLSGTQEQYQQNLVLARQQQDRFGGSLQDTVEGMSNFANLSRRTGIEISKLTNLARAMAIIDPAQGFKGAGIALKEFFSGDITSLARRFEIPRGALNDIKNIADEGERFAALEQTLAQYGITTELLAAQANSTATAYAKLSGSAADAQAAIGQGLAKIFQPLAEGTAKVLNQVADGITTLVTRGEQLDQFKKRIYDLTQTGGLDAFNAKIREINDQLPWYAGKLNELTPAQYAFASSLINTGTAADQAINKASELGNSLQYVMTTVNRHAVEINIANLTTADSFEAYSQAAFRAAAADENGALFAQQVAIAIANKRISVEQGTQALTQYSAYMEQAAASENNQNAATTAALGATQLFTAELTANTLEAANSAIQSEALKVQQEALMNAALAAAQGMGVTAQSAAVLANQFGITTSQAFGLISALQQLQMAKAAQDTKTSGIPQGYFQVATGFADPIELKKYKDLEKAKQDYIIATGKTAEKLQIERDRLRGLSQDSTEYWQQLAKVTNLEQQLQREQDKKGKGGAPKLTPNEKINVGLLDQLDKYNAKFEDAEAEHYDKLAEIYADYNKKVEEQMRKNEVSKRRSRADFYSGLQDAKGIDTQKFAAQYEEAFQKAQEIAQSGKAKLAQEYLEMRQKQIEEMKQLDEDAAKIKEDQKSGDLSKKDAEAQLAYLEGRRKLIQEAQDEELKQLQDSGDEYQNQLNEKLTAEEQRYNEQVDKISNSAERAADAKIKHAERSKIAVDAENKSLADQAGIYDRIAAKNGGQVPQSRQTPTGTASKPTAADNEGQKPVNVEASNPIPVSSAEALLVRQAEAFFVRDDAVFGAIGDMASRMEGKLGEVVGAVNDAKTAISSAVSAVEGAVGRIKINVTNSVVQQ